jgi:hypothetical protein
LLLLTLFKPSVWPASGGHRQNGPESLAESTLQTFCKAEFRKNFHLPPNMEAANSQSLITSRAQIQAALAAEEAQAQVAIPHSFLISAKPRVSQSRGILTFSNRMSRRQEDNIEIYRLWKT